MQSTSPHKYQQRMSSINKEYRPCSLSLLLFVRVNSDMLSWTKLLNQIVYNLNVYFSCFFTPGPLLPWKVLIFGGRNHYSSWVPWFPVAVWLSLASGRLHCQHNQSTICLPLLLIRRQGEAWGRAINSWMTHATGNTLKDEPLFYSLVQCYESSNVTS